MANSMDAPDSMSLAAKLSDARPWSNAGSRALGRPAATAPRRIRSRYFVQKRILDVMLCVLALPFALPLAALCAVAVRLSSPGPILFTQLRTGRGGRPFTLYKFRSMRVNAPMLKEELKARAGLTGPDFKLVRDPRVTPVGALLRKLSLDELPQLWNVLRGDMSLVGPRPTSFMAGSYSLWHTERLEVPPGLTGLWQITRRGDPDFDARVRLDILYARRRSLLFDLQILALTIPAVLRRHGAF
jgi:lipopolysaccharide/colanic/teichoic acid biosynthesis glycosyltransferase